VYACDSWRLRDVCACMLVFDGRVIHRTRVRKIHLTHSCNRRSMIMAAIIIYSITSCVGGYVSARVFRQLKVRLCARTEFDVTHEMRC
jgi:hypothetical protein